MSTETELAEEENLLKLGAVKSSYALIDLAASQIENRILSPGQVMNDNPASFANIFLENFGRLGAQSFYEQMMYKNEMLPSTAIKLRSIVNKLSSDDIASIYAYPARMTYVLGYNYNILVDLLKKNDNYIIINKNCRFSMEGEEAFVLDHNVKIILTNPDTPNQNIYAIYDKTDEDGLVPNANLSEVNNIYITSQVFYYNQTKVFGLFLNTRQMVRTIETITVTSENPDFELSYSDQLYGFEMHYKANGSNSYVKKSGLFDGNTNSNGYNYEISLDEKTISFTFNRTPEYWRPSIGDEIKVIIYTTKGDEGNFTIADIYQAYSMTKFEYAQDKDDIHQDCIVKTNPYVSIKDSGADSGKDALSFSEIKALAIERGANSNILTPGDLERKATKLNFAVKKIRNDVRCLEYRASGILEKDSDIVSSRNATLTFNFEDIPINSETSNRVLTPKMIYEYNKESENCEYKKDAESYLDYFESFRNEEKNEYMFPFHIRFTSNQELQADVFNMNRDNDLYNLNFLYYHQKTSFESSILSLVVNRDPVNENINNIPKSKSSIVRANGYYDFSFQVTTSAVVIANLASDESEKIIKYKVTISDGTNEYLLETHIFDNEIDTENNTVIVHAYIRTDDAISNNEKIMARDYSIEPVPFVTNPLEYYFLPEKVSARIYVIEKSTDSQNTSSYDAILTNSEKKDLYFVSTIYTAADVKLFEDYTSYFSVPADLSISQKEYRRYDSDIYKTYDSEEYLYNSDGTPVEEIKKILVDNSYIDISVTKILHNKGDFIYKTNSEMDSRELAEPISILTDTDINELLREKTNSELASMIEFDIPNMEPATICTYLDKFLGLKYNTTKEGSNTFLVNESGAYISDEILSQLQSKLNSYRTKIILHRIGEINTTGAIVKNESYKAIIKNVPMYDRIYAIGTGYKTALSTYNLLIDNIKSLQTYAPDGASICLGIKNTAGIGEYEVYDLNTSTWKDIDNIALSFSIGVKYSDDSNNDKDADNSVIIETIRNYINNFDDVSFGINTIFENVKEKLPSIEYLVLYKINQYTPSEVQSIRKKDGKSIVSDKLSVKQVVDADNTDLDSNTVSFKPDINIRVIS